MSELSNLGIQTRYELQSKDGWTLMPGAKANTGQSGSLGTGVFTKGTVAQLSCAPQGPYYDAGFSLAMHEFPDAPRFLSYYNEWLVDAENVLKAHQLEMDACVYDGAHRWHPAVAINMGSKTLKAFDPTQGWVDTKLPITITPGQWIQVEISGRLGLTDTKFYYFGFRVNGVWYPFEEVCMANPSTFTKQIKPILQIDSNKSGEKFYVQVQKTRLVWG